MHYNFVVWLVYCQMNSAAMYMAWNVRHCNGKELVLYVAYVRRCWKCMFEWIIPCEMFYCVSYTSESVIDVKGLIFCRREPYEN